ncbi:hypothetical protein HO133_006085 [Letharia lupina]|uniref:Uncharacterized protein n=1 Tax=Letharia lupina TaxID=560253 RepID=A0A8H6C746_9LECA|nr:uncharacterized protein HO133_006085 [Letharia lupina]KAF6218127.1 hypothetical protein HO133_006085 [Letharia lupina]
MSAQLKSIDPSNNISIAYIISLDRLKEAKGHDRIATAQPACYLRAPEKKAHVFCITASSVEAQPQNNGQIFKHGPRRD